MIYTIAVINLLIKIATTAAAKSVTVAAATQKQ